MKKIFTLFLLIFYIFNLQAQSSCTIDAEFTYTSAGCEYNFYTYDIFPSSDYFVSWDYGDGSTESGSDWVYHTYNSSGYFLVTAYVEDLNDPTCFDTYSELVFASCGSSSCNIDAEFTYTSAGCEYNFYTYDIYPSSGYYVTWDYGDGSTETGSDWVYHTYNSSGYFLVTAYVEDLNDPTCFDTYSELVFASCGSSSCNIDAEFTWSNNGLLVDFATINSFDPSLYTIEWDFGDGNTASGSDIVSNNYFMSGSFVVTLTITDISDPTCWDSYIDTVAIDMLTIPWSYTATGSNHTILIPSTTSLTLDNGPIANGDYLGVFYTDLNGDLQCGGYIQWDGTTVALTAWGDDAQTSTKDGFGSNEEFTWKLLHLNFGTYEEYTFTSVNYLPVGFGNITNQQYYADNGISGIESLDFSLFSIQSVELPYNWSIISTYILPVDPDISAVFSPVINDVNIIKNFTGDVYWPQYGLNTIGNVSITEGYQVKMEVQNLVDITGTQVNPLTTEMTVSQGWNIISYLRDTPYDIDLILGANSSDIVIVKSGSGLIYWPLYGINAIGNMNPGEGYQIKAINTFSFFYPANGTVIGTKQSTSLKPVHFTGFNNTGNNMTIGIPATAWGSYIPTYGDEISVYSTNGVPIGASVYSGDNTAITIWGDDFTTSSTEGIKENESFIFKLWNDDSDKEHQLTVESWLEGDNIYEKDGISVVENFADIDNTIESYLLYQNMPNPVSDNTTIKFFLAEDTNVELAVYNVLGKKLEILTSANFEKGEHQIIFNVEKYAAGNYYYKIVTPLFTDTKQLSIIK